MSFLYNTFQAAKALLGKKTTGAVIALVVSFVYFTKGIGKQATVIKLSAFLAALSQNLITEVIISGSKVMFRSIGSDAWYQTNASLMTKDRLFKILSKKPNVSFSCIEAEEESVKKTVAAGLLTACTYIIGYILFDLYFDKSKSKPLMKENFKSNTKFSDIYGLVEAKQELQEIVDFLKEPKKYREVGARLRRGVLLCGPPGTGKTLLARAIAGEANTNFLSCAASEFLELYVGVGPKRVRELFQRARQLAPCIIFIDEIDGIGSKRSQMAESLGGDGEKNSTLNQLLTEMDGFRENHDIVIIAATNRAPVLDDALVRSGRFDTQIKIHLPDAKDRMGIMALHLRNKKHEITEGKLEDIGEKTEGYSGADLENLINETAYICIQNKRNIINDEDLETSYQKIVRQRKVAL